MAEAWPDAHGPGSEAALLSQFLTDSVAARLDGRLKAIEEILEGVLSQLNRPRVATAPMAGACDLDSGHSGAASPQLDQLMAVQEGLLVEAKARLALSVSQAVAASRQETMGEARSNTAGRQVEVAMEPGGVDNSTPVQQAEQSRQPSTVMRRPCDSAHDSDPGGASSNRLPSTQMHAMRMYSPHASDKLGEPVEKTSDLDDFHLTTMLPDWVKEKVLQHHEPNRTGLLADLVKSKWFVRACLTVICADMLLSIYSTNWSAMHLTLDSPRMVHYSEIGVLVFYAVELALKLLVHRVWFFYNNDWGWNWLDITLVTLAILERIWSGYMDQTWMRLCRILRMGRTVKNLKAFHFLSSFRFMIMAIISSFGPFLWTVLLLLLILMQFSLLFMQGIVSYQIENSDRVTDEFNRNVQTYFGSVERTMLVLLQSVTGGCDWATVYDLLAVSGGFYSCSYVGYIVFFFISFLNISTSLFVEKALSLSKRDDDEIMWDKRHDDEKAATEIRKLIESLDCDESGTISYKEWKMACRQPDFAMFFKLCDLDIRDVESFFRAMMDITKSTSIEIDAFVGGCTRMKGQATSVDVQILLAEVRRLSRQVGECFRELSTR